MSTRASTTAVAALACSALVGLTACASTTVTSGVAVTASPATAATSSTSTTVSTTTAPSTTTITTTTTSTTTTSTTTTSTTTTSTTTSVAPTAAPATATDPAVVATPPAPVASPQDLGGGIAALAAADAAMPATNAAFEQLASWGEAASLTVLRDGEPIVARATGRTIAGGPVGTDTPMVVASVSKLLTEIALARLEQHGVLDLDTPIPWGFLGLQPHPGWAGVTARDLIGHAAGMPVVRTSWFTGEGDCRSYLSQLMAAPPRASRGTWTYSNGNFCALGLLVEFVAGRTLDEALGELVFDPAGVSRAHLTTDGQRPADVLYRRGVARLSRLGAAGNLLVSTDSVAGALASTTPADWAALHWPSGFVDQYGFGYTGTVGGATSCAWVLEGGRTVVSATVSGERPATGGAICDLVEPAIGSDLGFWAGRPTRSSI